MIKNIYLNSSSALKFKLNSNLFKYSIYNLNQNDNIIYTKRKYTIIGESVGPPKSFVKAYYELCELDYDSVEAFKVLIDKLQDNETKQLMTSFKNDHERHIKEITEVMKGKGEDVPSGPDIKQWLTKGKIYLSNITGDVGLLKGMLSNEKDLESAYEVMNKRNDQWPESLDMLKRGLNDEKRHRKGIEDRINSLEK